MTRALLVAALLSCACGETVDTAGLPSIDGYTSWHRIDVEGEAPGHGDTYRIIYVNDIARDYTGGGQYPPDSVMVKEIRAAGGPDGALQYLAIMRKIDGESTGVELDDGWLFTRADDASADEVRFDFCWASCHAQAPVDGAFYDYGR